MMVTVAAAAIAIVMETEMGMEMVPGEARTVRSM